MAEPADAGAGDAKVWKTAANADIASELRFSGPILSQGEIDSLLGFARGDEPMTWRRGISAAIDSTQAPHQRLPTLEVALDRLVRLMNTSLRNFTSGNVAVSVEQTASISFGDYLIPASAIVAVFRAGQIGNFGLVTVDEDLIHSAVSALLGARCGGAPPRVRDSPHTAIERTLVTRMIEVVLADAREAFSPLTEAGFQLDRIATNSPFSAMVSPGDAVVVVKVRIGIEERGGRLELALPYGAIEPMREIPPRYAMSEGRGNI